jgi:hypothetical protein
MKRIIFFFWFIASVSLFSQPYFNLPQQAEIVYDESFFYPNEFNIFGLGRFQKTAYGLIDDQLLNLNLNPAYVSDTSAYNVYLDFRNYSSDDYYYALPAYGGFAGYSGVRTNNNPVFNIAFLANPGKDLPGSFSFGITYQGIYTNRDYPFGYRESYLPDAAFSDYSRIFPPSYPSENAINGHLFSFYSAYKASNNLKLGLKVNFSGFSTQPDAGGFYGYGYGGYDYGYGYYPYYSSEHNFDQYEIAAGIIYNLSSRSLLGISAGFINGKLEQTTPAANYEPVIYPPGSYSFNHSSLAENSGDIFYLKLNNDFRIDDEKMIRSHYQFGIGTLDLNTSSTLVSTSVFTYSDTITTRSSQRSIRSGIGTKDIAFHRFSTSFLWDFSEKMTISFGFNYNRNSDVSFIKENNEQDAYYSTYNYYDSVSFNKLSTFEDSFINYSFNVPVLIDFRLNEYLELLFGFNWSFIQNRTSGYILDEYEYYIRRSQAENIELTKADFRYDSPLRKFSEVDRSFIGGITVKPADVIQIRFLAVPFTMSHRYYYHRTDVNLILSLQIFP